jgi:hypothetical protein
VFVEKYLPADEAKMKSELKEYLETLRSRQASLVFNEWLSAQIQSAGLAPAGRQ